MAAIAPCGGDDVAGCQLAPERPAGAGPHSTVTRIEGLRPASAIALGSRQEQVKNCHRRLRCAVKYGMSNHSATRRYGGWKALTIRDILVSSTTATSVITGVFRNTGGRTVGRQRPRRSVPASRGVSDELRGLATWELKWSCA